jgi:hypothetical protein
MADPSLYDQDFYAWANEQAALLRAGKLSAADIEHIAEEIESMGKTEKREMVSRLTVLLLHLLKWQYQQMLRGSSWRTTIIVQRLQLADHLDDNPSLQAKADEIVPRAYRLALAETAAETGLSQNTFRPACPWSFDQIMSADFWPGEAAH